MKKETLEEAAEKYVEDFDLSFYDKIEEIPIKEFGKEDFIKGANWQQERSYSEEDMRKAFEDGMANATINDFEFSVDRWFEQFKKK